MFFFRLSNFLNTSLSDSILIHCCVKLNLPVKNKFSHLPHQRNMFKSKTADHKKTFTTLKFDNLALKTLPIDKETKNFRRQVQGACFSYVQPEPLSNPRLMAYSKHAMKLIDIEPDEIEKDANVQYLSGNKIMKGSQTASHCYCGHQFGVFAGQLGDGAAIYLGEVINSRGERWEIQLKGAGPTPYSRSADGRKVVRSSIREFLASEAIHHLGIPTTRAGSVITSDSTVVRDIFYTGNPIMENCAVVLRLAPTFLRFGSFEIFKPTDPMSGMEGPSVGQSGLLRKMLDYTAETFFPEIWQKNKANRENVYLEMYAEIVRLTARLVVGWQCVGWVHGVLNTDNMSILGLTIDYGPFGFIDAFSPGHVSNTSDDQHRYSYKEQPSVCRWNCEKLAEAWRDVVPLEKTTKLLDAIYDKEYAAVYQDKLHRKFGLTKVLPTDSKLFADFFTTMAKTGADFTNSFRCLSRVPPPESSGFEESLSRVEDYLVTQCRTVDEMKLANTSRMDSQQLQMLLMLAQSQPGMLELFPGGGGLLKRELEKMERFKDIENLSDEAKQGKDRELWRDWLARYIDRLKVETIDDQERRVESMNENNPRVVLRNYLAQNAIVAAEKGQYAELNKLLRVLESPYAESVDLSELETGEYPAEDEGGSCQWKTYRRITDYTLKPPSWTPNIRVSCSS